MQIIRRNMRTITASFTRPADTTAYTAGDVASDSTSAPTVITFGRMTLGQGACASIEQAVCIDSANQATKPDLELWLFDTTLTPDNDNAVFTPTDAELATLVGVIAFPVASFKVGDATAAAAGNAICDVRGIGLPFCTAGGVNNSNGLFGVVVVRNAYTPVASEQFTFRLKVID